MAPQRIIEDFSCLVLEVTSTRFHVAMISLDSPTSEAPVGFSFDGLRHQGAACLQRQSARYTRSVSRLDLRSGNLLV
jgi:hypothetical protein